MVNKSVVEWNKHTKNRSKGRKKRKLRSGDRIVDIRAEKLKGRIITKNSRARTINCSDMTSILTRTFANVHSHFHWKIQSCANLPDNIHFSSNFYYLIMWFALHKINTCSYSLSTLLLEKFVVRLISCGPCSERGRSRGRMRWHLSLSWMLVQRPAWALSSLHISFQ